MCGPAAWPRVESAKKEKKKLEIRNRELQLPDSSETCIHSLDKSCIWLGFA